MPSRRRPAEGAREQRRQRNGGGAGEGDRERDRAHLYLPLSLLLVYWPRRTHPRPDVPEPPADPTTAASSKRGFWQRITCRHLGGRLGAPVLFLRLRQKHPCPAHLPILVLAPKNHLCASVPKGFWGGGRGGTRAFSAMRVVLLRHKQDNNSAGPGVSLRTRTGTNCADPSHARLSRFPRHRLQGADCLV